MNCAKSSSQQNFDSNDCFMRKHLVGILNSQNSHFITVYVISKNIAAYCSFKQEM